MRIRGQLTFLILNVLVTILVVVGVTSFLNTNSPQDAGLTRFATVQVIITATSDLNATPLVRIITATPGENEIAALPTGVLDATPAPGTTLPESTLDPRRAADQGSQAAGAGTPTLPDGCITHTLESGENPSILAERYEADLFRILEVNGLNDENVGFLQIGQALIIPLENCPLTGSQVTPEGEATAEGTGEPIDAEVVVEGTGTAAPTETPTPTLTPTITLAPTAANAQVEIIEVIAAGDVTSEAVIVYNNGRTVDITGWTLRDLDGNVFTFPEQRLFNDSSIEVFTQVGTNSPVRKYWGLTEPVFGAGDVAILSNAQGEVQSVFRIPAPVNLN